MYVSMNQKRGTTYQLKLQEEPINYILSIRQLPLR